MKMCPLIFLLLIGCAQVRPVDAPVEDQQVAAVDIPSIPLIPSALRHPCEPSPSPPPAPRTIDAIAQWAQAVEVSKQKCATRYRQLLTWIDRNME